MLLVVNFHPRALLLLPQWSYNTDRDLSRTSLNCLQQRDTECTTTTVLIRSIAHMICIQSRLHSLWLGHPFSASLFAYLIKWTYQHQGSAQTDMNGGSGGFRIWGRGFKVCGLQWLLCKMPLLVGHGASPPSPQESFCQMDALRHVLLHSGAMLSWICTSLTIHTLSFSCSVQITTIARMLTWVNPTLACTTCMYMHYHRLLLRVWPCVCTLATRVNSKKKKNYYGVYLNKWILK